MTLTSDVGRILARLHQVQPKGNISFLTAVRVAHVSCSSGVGNNMKVSSVLLLKWKLDLYAVNTLSSLSDFNDNKLRCCWIVK